MRSNKLTIRHLAFWPPVIALLGAVILSLVNNEAFVTMVNTAFGWVTTNFGWLFALATFSFVVLVIVIAISPASAKIRLGGENAKPEFSLWNWFAMTLCGGIAIGVVFWGAAEPIYHLASPPASLGIEPFSEQAALFGMSTIFLHWTISPYAMYVVCGLSIALAYYNYGKPMTVSSSLYFLLGDKAYGTFGSIIDAVAMFGLVGTLCASLGAGIMQLGRGLEYVFGLEPSVFIWTCIAVFIVAAYTLSSYTGINKGIRILSDQNAKLFLGVLVFIFIAGPTVFILNLGVQGLGEYIIGFVPKSLWLSPVEGDQWNRWWSLFYWAAWIACAPITGIFLARIAYGRTIRQFIVVNLIGPAIFGFLWFSVFSGAAIDMQLTGKFDLWALINDKGLESAVFGFFSQFPLGSILTPIFLIVICISFITFSDSMTTCLAIISTTKDYSVDGEPPAILKFFWGIVMGAVALVAICFAGIDGVKMLAIIAGWPITFIVIAAAISGVKGIWWPEEKWFGNKNSTNVANLSSNDVSTK